MTVTVEGRVPRIAMKLVRSNAVWHPRLPGLTPHYWFHHPLALHGLPTLRELESWFDFFTDTTRETDQPLEVLLGRDNPHVLIGEDGAGHVVYKVLPREALRDISSNALALAERWTGGKHGSGPGRWAFQRAQRLWRLEKTEEESWRYRLEKSLDALLDVASARVAARINPRAYATWVACGRTSDAPRELRGDAAYRARMAARRWFAMQVPREFEGAIQRAMSEPFDDNGAWDWLDEMEPLGP